MKDQIEILDQKNTITNLKNSADWLIGRVEENRRKNQLIRK